jgi:predicted metal-dependent HD superfamily phosphohydrolase
VNDLAQFLLARLREQPPADVDAQRIAVLDWQRAIAAERVGWQTYEVALRRLAARYAGHPDFHDQWRIDHESQDGPIDAL